MLNIESENGTPLDNQIEKADHQDDGQEICAAAGMKPLMKTWSLSTTRMYTP